MPAEQMYPLVGGNAHVWTRVSVENTRGACKKEDVKFQEEGGALFLYGIRWGRRHKREGVVGIYAYSYKHMHDTMRLLEPNVFVLPRLLFCYVAPAVFKVCIKWRV